MSTPNEIKRVSLRIKRVEAEKLRTERGETRARAVKAKNLVEKRSSGSSKSSSSDKENKPVTKAKKTTPPKNSVARKTTSKPCVQATPPQVQNTSNTSAPKRPLAHSDDSGAGPSEPKRAVKTSTSSQEESTSSTSSARPLGPTHDSEAGPSEPRRVATTSAPQNEEVREKKPYTKYDLIPDEYVEPNWWTRPAVKTTEDSPILFKQKIASIVLGEGWEEDKVEYSEPPSRPKAVTAEPEPIPSSNEHMQLMHALQHFVHTLNKVDTDAFEKLCDEINNLVGVMEAEKKAKNLSLYAIQMDTYMYQIFTTMKTEQDCQGEGIYVRQFFELLKKSIGVWYTKFERSKEDMMLILQQNLTPLKMYGEKKVIPCDKIIYHIKRFAEHILKDSREF
ncbi:hypothetical protein CAEBREN_20019 [Caenorhabditis brenneri]|uniref:Uncharacterized protein n=1 Tax=Caenorhabditis brenneri TaxID=135651 RepID=G0MU91_CAEBE|nr:hypothetical protein CAEBREN_20019 [Caenorhabditis brenneri]